MQEATIVEQLRDGAREIDVDGTPAQVGPSSDQLRDAISLIDRQQHVIDLLLKAVEPFAEYAACKCDCCNYDEDVIAGPVTNDQNFEREITMRDLRRARKAKAEAERMLATKKAPLPAQRETDSGAD